MKLIKYGDSEKGRIRKARNV